MNKKFLLVASLLSVVNAQAADAAANIKAAGEQQIAAGNVEILKGHVTRAAGYVKNVVAPVADVAGTVKNYTVGTVNGAANWTKAKVEATPAWAKYGVAAAVVAVVACQIYKLHKAKKNKVGVVSTRA